MTTAAVYQAFSADLRAWFGRRAPADQVDDLVQDAFVRIHRGLPGLRDRDRLAPWVYRIARSVLVDRARRLGPVEVDAPEPIQPDEPDATAVVAAWLPGMIATLPEPYRTALELSELEGLTQQQVAARLGISASGARTRVQRGRRRLRETLDACCAVRMEEGAVVDVRPNPPCGC